MNISKCPRCRGTGCIMVDGMTAPTKCPRCFGTGNVPPQGRTAVLAPISSLPISPDRKTAEAAFEEMTRGSRNRMPAGPALKRPEDAGTDR